jgi:GT2 family glycosyltransferase
MSTPAPGSAEPAAWRKGTARVAAVIPTLGKSPLLTRCLTALGGPARGVERIVVVPADTADLVPPDSVERVVPLSARAGFSVATNVGIAAAGDREYVATVNDDAIVEAGWLDSLLGVLDGNPRAGAAQGVNLRLDAPERVDGCGLTWNHRWQAAQIGAGDPPPDRAAPPREVFGVSATAALYRHAALSAARGAHGVFDERLDSFYEDVELSGRLRGAGFTAWCVPAARAAHAGSLTAARTPVARTAWIYGNRFLVLAALLGREWHQARARALRADLVDALRALAAPRTLAGIALGWARAARRLRAWRHEGPPLVARAELTRLGADASAR